ncbi:MAG: tetratricopeptide repeat-containing sensor histidine kinase [Bacteroidales bacterium]|nr:tetratricopeptide repeat-containing sensor histidine kinase [Bacteroidales bacterium]
MIFSNIFKKLFLIVFFLGVSLNGNTSGALLLHDSLLKIIESDDSPDTLLFEAYYRLSWELKSTVPLQALEYANEALRIAEKLNRQSKIADALSYIGVIYWQMGNFNMALVYHQEANSIYTEIQDQKGIARSNTNLGIIFSNQSYYDRALDYYFKALMLYEEIDNQSGMAAVLNNIGMVYEYQKDYELAERYHLQSLEIKQKLNDPKGMAFSYNNLGLVYQGQGELELANDYFLQALKIRIDLNDKREIASTYGNLGNLFFLLKDYRQSEQYLNKSLELYKEVDDKSGIAKIYNSLGRLYKKWGNMERSVSFFEHSMEISKTIGLNRMVTENYLNLAEVMHRLGDYESAYQYQQKYIVMRDSIYSEESRRKIYELQFMYDREQKESELQLLRKNEQITMLSSQRDKLLRNFLIIGVIMILVSLFLLYNRFLILRNSNVLLEKQKEEISESNAQLVELNHSLMEQKKMYEELNYKLNLSNQKLKESEKNLMEINATKDKFFSIISHDLRNPFASIVSFSRILKRDILNMNKDELKELALELDKSVLKIDNLLENLLQWSRTQTGKIKYRPEYIALHEIIKENLNLVQNNARDKNIILIDTVDDDLAVWADRNMTDTVIRNLLSNALKYTEQGGEIKLSSYLKDHKVHISVKDNGVGIADENKRKIFQTDSLHSTYGTMDEKGSGLGLLLCKEFVEKQGGEIFFESERGKGSVFTFSLPCEQF